MEASSHKLNCYRRKFQKEVFGNKTKVKLVYAMQPLKARSRNRISIDILRAIREIGLAKPTRILQKTNLTHDRLVRNLGELHNKKLIEENAGNGYRYYTLTESGIKFLEEMERNESYLSEFGLYL